MKGTSQIMCILGLSMATTFSALDGDSYSQPIPPLEPTVPAIDELKARISTLETELSNTNKTVQALQTTMDQLRNDFLKAAPSETLSALGKYIRVVYGPINGLKGPHIIFSGVNLHLRSGAGITSGELTGRGNLIVGYNEGGPGNRGGSHNIVLGPYHEFSSYGGLVAGMDNIISGPYATVLGGSSNQASGDRSTIGGGFLNTASGILSAVDGGFENIASGGLATISGGALNLSSGSLATVGGGSLNSANGLAAHISGGSSNSAEAQQASISGGAYNTASGWQSTVSGGRSRHAIGEADWVAGGIFQSE